MIQNEIPIPLDNGAAEKLATGDQVFSAWKGLSLEDALDKLAGGLVDFAFKLMIAILVYYVGRFIIRKIYKLTLNVMTRRNMDASLTTFVLSLIKMVLYFILIITIIGILGLETSSFLAIFASAGVALGMALSGTLQNFAGGVLILLLKPYRIGDYIEAQGYAGTVKSIQLFSTVINTIDNKAIIIPNGILSTGTINNYSLEQYRRVDWKICLSYDTDFEKAKEVIMQMLLSDERIVKKYVEDDMELRAKIQKEEDCEKNPENCGDKEEGIPTEKKTFWEKLHLTSRKKREKLKEKISDSNMEMNAVIPKKIEREPFVALGELADSSIDIVVRAWTHSSNYWNVYYDMNALFFRELPIKGFSFPFPQLDVHFDSNVKSNA